MAVSAETSYENTKKVVCDRLPTTLDPLLKDVYYRGWHDGRHYDRDKWEQCGYLIIDPARMKELNEKTEKCPCHDCPCATTELKIGCYKGRINCKPYQDYLFLWELKEHFAKNECNPINIPSENKADDLMRKINNN